MYKQEIKHRVLFETKDDLPKFIIGFRFNDYFTEETYMLESNLSNNNFKQIPFVLLKNNEVIENFVMIDYNIDKMLMEVIASIDDVDLQDMFIKNNKEAIISEIHNFFNSYQKTTLLNEINYSGELKRMKEVAGITPRYVI